MGLWFRCLSAYEGLEAFFLELLIEKQIYLESDEKLKNTLSALSVRQDEAMYLRHGEGLTYQEIGEIMHIKTQSIYNLIFRSIQFLKDQLKDVNYYLKTFAFMGVGWQLSSTRNGVAYCTI